MDGALCGNQGDNDDLLFASSVRRPFVSFLPCGADPPTPPTIPSGRFNGRVPVWHQGKALNGQFVGLCQEGRAVMYGMSFQALSFHLNL